MEITEYQERLLKIQDGYRYNPDRLMCLTLGLFGEAGELVEVIKKSYRDGSMDTEKLKAEAGDLLAYITLVGCHYGIDLETIAYNYIYVGSYSLPLATLRLPMAIAKVVDAIADDLEGYGAKPLTISVNLKWSFMYLIHICHGTGLTLADLMQSNLVKLEDRQNRQVLHGTGDYR